MPRTGKKARLAVDAVLAATASPEPSPQKAEKGKQRSAPTPVEVDDSRYDSLARPYFYLLALHKSQHLHMYVKVSM